MIALIYKIKERFRKNREVRRANSDSRTYYYLHKTRAQKI